ncbi:MAG: hypothetical protein ACOCQ9_02445 [Candidatus Brocadiia bacterium]
MTDDVVITFRTDEPGPPVIEPDTCIPDPATGAERVRDWLLRLRRYVRSPETELHEKGDTDDRA